MAGTLVVEYSSVNERSPGRDSSTPSHLCHVEGAFSLLGHILTHDRLNMSNRTLHHLAIMCVNKMDKKRKCDEEE